LASHFYYFSMIYYEFPKSDRKRKRKMMNSDGLKLAQVGPRTGESAPAVSGLHGGPWVFEKPLKRPLHYFSVSLTFADRPFPFLFLHKSRSLTTAAEQWLQRACTGAQVCLTPNSTPNDHYPSINCKVLAPNLSVHGDSANYG
jgi:hypothetical protein